MTLLNLMISVVFPAYNEEGNVVELHRQILEALKKTGQPYEIVAVDNASTDKTYERLKTLSPIKIVRLAFNLGQTAGLDAGIKAAAGDVVMILDADLQNDPADIPAMFQKLEEGYDLVAGWRANRNDSFGRKVFSFGANRITRFVLGIKMHDYACGSKMFRKSFLEGIHLYGEMHVFLSGIMHFRGARITEMKVRHHHRTSGLSKHTFIKGAKDLADLFTIRFLFGTTRPLVVFGALGLFFFFLSGLSLISAIVLKVIHYANFAQTPLPVVMAFFGMAGLMLCMMGLIAELVLRSYYEARNTTPYVVSSVETH